MPPWLCSYCFLCLEHSSYHLANLQASFGTKITTSDLSENLLNHLLLNPLAMRSDPHLSKNILCMKISCFLLLSCKFLQTIVIRVGEISKHIMTLDPAPGLAPLPKQLGNYSSDNITIGYSHHIPELWSLLLRTFPVGYYIIWSLLMGIELHIMTHSLTS